MIKVAILIEVLSSSFFLVVPLMYMIMRQASLHGCRSCLRVQEIKHHAGLAMYCTSKQKKDQIDLTTFECKFTMSLIRTEATSTTAYYNSILVWFAHDGVLQKCITVCLLPHEEAHPNKKEKRGGGGTDTLD